MFLILTDFGVNWSSTEGNIRWRKAERCYLHFLLIFTFCHFLTQNIKVFYIKKYQNVILKACVFYDKNTKELSAISRYSDSKKVLLAFGFGQQGAI
jgi:hypothetical protein